MFGKTPNPNDLNMHGRTPMYGAGAQTPMYGGAQTPMHDCKFLFCLF